MSTNPTTSRFTLRSTVPGLYTLTLNGQEVADCTAVSVVVDAGDIARVRLDIMPWEIDIDIDAEIEENRP